jgi:hypothetical protein
LNQLLILRDNFEPVPFLYRLCDLSGKLATVRGARLAFRRLFGDGDASPSFT